MKRRIGIVVAMVAFLSLGSTSVQALSNTTAAHWGCVGVQLIDQGVCLSNPLPERLPLPN